MPLTPEQQAREIIDHMLEASGWVVQDYKAANLSAGQGVVLREFPLQNGHGTADYLFYVDAKAAGVIEAKKVGTTLTGVEIQSTRYSEGLPEALPAYFRPLPFSYQSTGVVTRFTNGLDPAPRSRQVFSFHRPATLAKWLTDEPLDSSHSVGEDRDERKTEQAATVQAIYRPATLRSRLQTLPPLIEDGLWPAQVKAIHNLEKSFAEDRPRALIQMATGSGKTFTAVNFIYRLIKFGGARRVLFLVDRANLGRQALKEFKQFDSPHSPHKFTEEFIVQHLSSNKLDTTARVSISTIQRLYSILKGDELAEEVEEESLFDHTDLFKEPPPVEYNPDIPVETFDFIITDECHRSIYGLWRQVLEYFDAFLIGLTATPNKQAFGFFNQNLVMEYPHEQAVADGVNVNYDVYRIRTAITQKGSDIEAGYYVDKRDKETKEVKWELLDEDFSYDPNQLDRDVVAVDQIRTVVKTFKEKLFTEIFPGRTNVPKTLIFAKDDSHADDIVKVVREEFGKGNDFAQKITYKTTGKKPEELIAEFRNSYFPRIVVTVDMIATGTDVKPLEVVLFMRTVNSRTYFEQMKGRGVRVINETDLRQVTPDAKTKTHFVIVDVVGVCENKKEDTKPLERKPSIPLEKLLQAVALGNTEVDVISSIAGRLARLDRKISDRDREEIKDLAGKNIKKLISDLVAATVPDAHIERAKLDNPGIEEPTHDQVKQAANKMISETVKLFHNPDLRRKIVEAHKATEQIIDHLSQDSVIEAGFDEASREKAKDLVESFEKFIEESKDEITALQVLYSQPYKSRLTFNDIKDLAEAIERPPYLWRIGRIWEAYAALDQSKVKGAGAQRLLTDIVSLVRYALHQEDELIPYDSQVQERYEYWLEKQRSTGKTFTEEQLNWLEMIRDHISASIIMETSDFDGVPFNQEGGLGKAHQIFGDDLDTILIELNNALVA